VVGGIPWIEYTEADLQQHVRELFDLAQEYNKDVSMLVDDAGDPGLRSVETVAVEAIRRGWQGRALAHHARAMALYPQPYFQKLAALLKRANMAVVSDPHTGPLHARVKELLQEGVTVCLGQDDISDAYYPFGRNNMLEAGCLSWPDRITLAEFTAQSFKSRASLPALRLLLPQRMPIISR